MVMPASSFPQRLQKRCPVWSGVPHLSQNKGISSMTHRVSIEIRIGTYFRSNESSRQTKIAQANEKATRQKVTSSFKGE
jgi:hypothetical protein